MHLFIFDQPFFFGDYELPTLMKEKLVNGRMNEIVKKNVKESENPELVAF